MGLTSSQPPPVDFVDWTPEQHLDAATALLDGGYPAAGDQWNLAWARVLRGQWHIAQAQVKQMRAMPRSATPPPATMFRVLRAELHRERMRRQQLNAMCGRWQRRTENRARERERYLRRIV